MPLPPAGSMRLEQAQGRINQLLRSQTFSGKGLPPGSITTRMSPEGLVISLNEFGFFSSGSADLQPAAIGTVIDVAATLPNANVRVEGHTDDRPIHTAQFASNWELSTARASAIARLLREHSRVQAPNLSASGYAEFHPVTSNATGDGRRRNRRVDIILLRDQAPSR